MPRYLDLSGEIPRVGFHTRTELAGGGNLSRTPEGYLLCRNVPLARTGTQIYLAREVPVEPGPDGTVVVERLPEEVFRQETIDSFQGKPFTDDHPYEDVTPRNYRDHLAGVILNPRRGEGDLSNYLLGDILVYSSRVADAILSGKRQVSCGYDADYERVQAGYGRQRNILGNHVSLVAEGRCGPSCAIIDQRTVGMATPESKSWIDTAINKIRNAFKTSDAGEMEAAIAAMQEELEKADAAKAGEGESGEENHHHIHIHFGENDKDDADEDEDEESGESKDEDTSDEDGDDEPSDKEGEDDTKDEDTDTDDSTEDDDMTTAVAEAITAALAPLVERLEKLEGSVRDAATVAQSAAVAADPEGRITQDALARAELLKPGIQLPVFDAAPGSPQATEALVAFQRRALQEGYATADGRAAIAPLLTTPGHPRFESMSAGEIGLLFRAASNTIRDANNAKLTAPQHVGPQEMRDGKLQPVTNQSWNDANKRFWKR
jgi:hypothetical protein